ncbi:MAG: DUF1330 domain-containing protein [Acidimicrobiia bacterium]|nr:DUF1330 domain-containing protein [Acidimicrobiia bacterium]
MSEQATLVVTAIPNTNDVASMQEYLQNVMPLLTGAGGSLVKRLKVDQVVQGTPAGMVMVMDFDSADAVTALFDSDDYAALIPARDRGFAEMNILVTTGM